MQLERVKLQAWDPRGHRQGMSYRGWLKVGHNYGAVVRGLARLVLYM